MKKTILAVLAAFTLSCNTVTKKEYQDPEKLWGELYSEVEKAKIFDNPKEFWDAAPQGNAKSVLKYYEEDKNKPDFNLEQFIKTYFTLPDYSTPYATSDKSFEDYIKTTYSELLRSPKDDGGTLIPTLKKYVSGGGMFQEANYATGFYNVKAYQALKQDTVAKNIATNNYQFIQDYGYVPYGNRSYYLGFSDFPMLSLMSEAVAEKDLSMLPWFGNLMARDYQIWMGLGEDEDAAALKKREGNAYKTVVFLDTEQSLNRFYNTNQGNAYINPIKSTGWENSSRYLKNNTQKPQDFVPVDLNAVLYHQELFLARSFEAKGRKEYVESYQNLAKVRKELFDKFLYNSEKGFYYDFDFETKTQSNAETLAALYPILTGMANQEQTDKVVDKIEKQFLTPHGLLNDLSQNYGSAEMNYLAILALRKANKLDLANKIKDAWIETNKSYFATNKHILPVYDLKNLEESPKTPKRIDAALAVLITLINE